MPLLFVFDLLHSWCCVNNRGFFLFSVHSSQSSEHSKRFWHRLRYFVLSGEHFIETSGCFCAEITCL